MLLGLASALVYLLAFTLPYWLPTYYLHVEDEIYAFAAREPWRGVLFYLALGALVWALPGCLPSGLSGGSRGKQPLAGPLVGRWSFACC